MSPFYNVPNALECLNDKKRKTKQKHNKTKQKQEEKLNNIYKSIAFFKKICKCLSPCSVKCTECFRMFKRWKKSYYFNDKKEKQNKSIKFYFINKYRKINTKMFREIKPDKHRKKITFLYTEDGKVENVNGIANTLTDDLKSKVSVEKEFKDVKEFN